MNRLASVAVIVLAGQLAGCSIGNPSRPARPVVRPDVAHAPYPTVRPAEVPVMNLPLSARQRNYNGGSCVCASTISALRWQGQDELAQRVREACSGGQSSGSLHSKLERLGIRYAYTTNGDVKFLEWCVRTRRGCGITFFSNHFINLVHLDSEKAILMDNNHPQDFITLSRDEFVRRWKGFGGWATAVVYQPPPPLAFVAQRRR